MGKISTIKKNILYFIENQNIKKEDFYRNIGISASNFKGIGLSSELSSDKIVKIMSFYPSINSEWLLTGKGEMLKSEGPAPVPSPPPDLMLAQRDIIDLQKDKIRLLEEALEDQRRMVAELKKELADQDHLGMRPKGVR